MPYPPNRLIEEAFLAPTVEVTRRVEVYEFDGVTPWKPEIWNEILISGTVNVASDQDSRRSADFDFFNYKGNLTPDSANGSFWYDKVIKAFYGIVTHQERTARNPNIIIVEEESATGQALKLKNLLIAAGYSAIDYNPLVESYSELVDYDIVVSISGDYTRKLALLTQAYISGKSVLTFNLNSTAAQLPLVISNTGTVRSGDQFRHFELDDDTADPVQNGWQDWYINTPETYRPIIATPGKPVSIDNYNTFSLGSVMADSSDAGVWIHTQMADFSDSVFQVTVPGGTPTDYKQDFIDYLGAIVARADTYDAVPVWEQQIGEFVIEGIADSDDLINGSVTVTARDYTKRCQISKLAKATMFTKDERIVDIIKALAQNSNITKFKLPETLTTTLDVDTTYERDQDRWSIMKEIATSNNMDIWFDIEGYLRLTPQQDPLLTPATLQLTTGRRGNLITRGRKTSDASLFNHVTVIGESSDTTVVPVFGEAINDDPASPSSTVNIGERTKNYSSALVTSDLEALNLARTMLSVAGLEEFELSFSSILFPWVEAGEIVEMNDEISNNQWAPARYLITSLSLPLDLSPMTGTGKRVTKV